MNNHTTPPKESRALLRYEVICFITQLREQGAPLAECLRDAAARPWPATSGHYHSHRTIETWYYQYVRGGFAALSGTPKRSDDQHSRTMSEATGIWLISQIKATPGIPLTVLLRQLRKEEQGRQLPSDSSIRRFLTAHGYDRRSLRAGRLESGPQKAFEAPSPNDLWMTDFATGPKLTTAEGKVLETHLCIILDDHSRLITHAAYYSAQTAATFLESLREAVLRRGRPHKLYTDQGKQFISHHARIVCANLDIRLLHARPYHAWSKGKVERLIRTIQDDFEATLRLPGKQVHSLAELNSTLARWVEGTYHLRPHSSTHQSPHDRFASIHRTGHGGLSGPIHIHPPLRPVADPQNIGKLFYTRTKRVVRKDGIISIDTKLYEVDLALRALEIELRYDPQTMDPIEVWHHGRSHGHARKADLHLNSQTYSRNQHAR